MKKLILATVSAAALFGVAACSDSTDTTTTQSVEPPVTSTPAPSDPAMSPTPTAPSAPAEEMKPAEPAAPAPAPAQ